LISFRAANTTTNASPKHPTASAQAGQQTNIKNRNQLIPPNETRRDAILQGQYGFLMVVLSALM